MKRAMRSGKTLSGLTCGNKSFWELDRSDPSDRSDLSDPGTEMSDQPAINRSAGRKYFWIGILLCLAGLILVAVQYGAGRLIVPWYSPIMATVGAGFLL